ncbi:MAG: fluoride efflux transporter CrcB [Anaerolineales bacterium]|nr:fluoride efflux transporter CrcB [Anaerolineales bacterium]
MGKIILIGLGGFIGAIFRYFVSGYVQEFSKSASFPYGTLVVNVLGSFVLGFLYYFIESRGALTPEMRALLLIGMLGAFTTFSTFSLETLNLVLHGEFIQALANLSANFVLGLMAVWAGRMLPVLIWR